MDSSLTLLILDGSPSQDLAGSRLSFRFIVIYTLSINAECCQAHLINNTSRFRPLFRDTFFPPIITRLCFTIGVFQTCGAPTDSLCPSPSIHPYHELRVRPRHHLDVLLHQESVIELSCGFAFPVLDVSNLAVNPNLHPSVLGICRSQSVTPDCPGFLRSLA